MLLPSNTNTIKSIHYFVLQLLYTIYPSILFWQYDIFEGWAPFASIIISIITLIRIYIKIEHINIEHIKYLKYYNLLLSGIFYLIFTLISLITNQDIGTKLFLTCFTPLLFLNVVYETISLYSKRKNINTFED